MKKNRYLSIIAAVGILLSGCGGGGGNQKAPVAGEGKGLVKAYVSLQGSSGQKRYLARNEASKKADAANDYVVVDIVISGYYGEDDSEFPPIVAEVRLNPVTGQGYGAITEVPIGVNHLLTAIAHWGSETETIKTIVDKVEEGRTTTEHADVFTTIAADAAIQYGKSKNKRLDKIDSETILNIEKSALELAAGGMSYTDISPDMVLAYMEAVGANAGILIYPQSADVTVGAQQQFTATVTDSGGNVISGANITWSLDNNEIGTIGTNGLFTASSMTGSGNVVASYGALAAMAPVTVSLEVADAVCGNETTETGEDCDDGNDVTETCDYGILDCSVCDSSCATVSGETSYCGDAVTDVANGETCDSGSENGAPNMCNQSCDGTTSATCGNGTVETGEACDDGGESSSCNADCTSAICGDGVINGIAGETCDDGNAITEACEYGLTSCTVCGSTCGTVSGAVAYCGDGITDSAAGETCDDGNTITETCSYGQTSCAVCDSTCASISLPTSYCGDGTIDSGNGETCDDGGNNGQPNMCNQSCDGTTSATCGNGTVESGEACDDGQESTTCNADCSAASCGDGITNGPAGETCDDGNAVTETCSYGQTSCSVCDSTCASVSGAASYCGDGSIDNGAGETCDDNNAITETCSYGQTSCSVCDSTCASVSGAASYCGDGNIDSGAGETCDDSNAVTETCAYGDPGCTVCDATCASVSGAASYCGDGSIDSGNGETCDDGNTVTEACVYGGTNCTVCDSTCSSVSGSTSYCGDGMTDSGAGETCDDGNTITETCAYGATSCSVCDSNCASVSGSTSYCGDGVTDSGAGETCDDSNAVTETCAYGVTSCSVCDSNCASVSGSTSYCGDGVTDSGAGETCDDSNAVTETCAYGATSCSVCDSNCASVSGSTSYCGDGTIDGGNGETCDDGGNNGNPNACNNSCDGLTATVCGNGIVERGEECDDGGTGNADGCSNYCFTEIDPVMEFVCGININYNEGAECWGRNLAGEIGDGTTTTRLTPTPVSGLTSGVKQIKANGYQACALTTAGGVKCWGANNYGQLGDGTTTNRLTAVDVTGLTSGVKQISAGSNHTCALMTTGGVKCWGWNAYGQLGDGTGTDRLTPVDVSGLSSGVSYIAASGFHTCALLDNGGMKCWGRGNYGSLGDGSWGGAATPVDVVGLTSGVVSIAPSAMDGLNMCALLDTGGVKCWGYNITGQLGDGTNTDSNTPVDVTGLTSGVKFLGAGFQHNCAITTGDVTKCWGNNAYGTLGDGTTVHNSIPVNASVPSGTVAVIRGGRTITCYRTTTGDIYCWGDNSYGQRGAGVAGGVSNSPMQTLTNSICGDAIIDPAKGETCDDGNNQGDDGCSATCITETIATNVWITIPAGDFIMGCGTGDVNCGSAESPTHVVTLSSYHIQKYEVTNSQYQACVDASACTAPNSFNSTAYAPYYGNATYNNYPVINVDWNQATTYCAWLGGRLPTEAEWEKAARGPYPSESIYPWGNGTTTCALANHTGCSSDVNEDGIHPTGASYYNAMDMAGNVWEWVHDYYDATYYSTGGPTWIDPQGPVSGTDRTVRGSSWGNGMTTVRNSNRLNIGPTFSYPDVGFRCAQD